MTRPAPIGSSALGPAAADGMRLSSGGLLSGWDPEGNEINAAAELRGGPNFGGPHRVASVLEALRGAGGLQATRRLKAQQHRPHVGGSTEAAAAGGREGGAAREGPIRLGVTARPPYELPRSHAAPRGLSVAAASRRSGPSPWGPSTGPLPSLEASQAGQSALWAQVGLSASSVFQRSISFPLLPPAGPLMPPVSSSSGAPTSYYPGAPDCSSKCQASEKDEQKTPQRPSFSALPWARPFRSSTRRLWSSPGSFASHRGPPGPPLGAIWGPQAPHLGPPGTHLGPPEPLGPPAPPLASRLKVHGGQGLRLQHRASAGDLLQQRLQQQQQQRQQRPGVVRREASWAQFFRGPREQQNSKREEKGGDRPTTETRRPVASWSLLTVHNFSGAAKAAAAKKKWPTAAAAATAAAAPGFSFSSKGTAEQQTEEEAGGPLDAAEMNLPRPQDIACAALEAAATAADSLAAFAPHVQATAAAAATPAAAIAAAAAALVRGKPMLNKISKTTKENPGVAENGLAAATAATTSAASVGAAPAVAAATAATAGTDTETTAAPPPAQANSPTRETEKGGELEAAAATEATARATAVAAAATPSTAAAAAEPSTKAAAAAASPAAATATAEGGCKNSLRHHSRPDASGVVPPLVWQGLPASDSTPQTPCSSNSNSSSRCSSSQSTSRWDPAPLIPSSSWKVFDIKRPLRLKIVTVGPQGSGKSCLVRRFCERRFAGSIYGAPGSGGPHGGPQGTVTIGWDFGLRDVQLPTDETVRLHFFDFSGDPVYAEAAEGALEGADVLLVVYDAKDPRSLQEALDTLEMAREAVGAQEALTALVAAKADGSAAAAAGAAAGEAAAAAAGARFYAACAETADGVDTLFLETAAEAAAAARARAAALLELQPQQQRQKLQQQLMLPLQRNTTGSELRS
ncbi:Ras family domain-containing protein, putative [Eimeria mitis]|uniref:Ras family domain-containing protein, putative n=1 Tax=Eimeria mitis TaxID=44415 RepID=U6KBS8_9EIME|nr:Ras family domain-containing protein, putative [Eimeria mitis]CDJ33702.1 Ras family domain-containing protein, putative [Eimeria mitis]